MSLDCVALGWMLDCDVVGLEGKEEQVLRHWRTTVHTALT